ncbi:hypothetical protein EMPS_06409 [Entomortierella parvispora]|uniref:Uncharacterized protein n=1 Tax=Entomortierella parvispora TaxID=205924 RepID=A0A9P3LX71_9FUNG|nr:hypothetical protein EMPS_06409 [Entomortierella parvispora]
MTTTQIQVQLYVGSRPLVSCHFFVPIPEIVVKSHQQLESYLPYLPLPLAITSALTNFPDPELPSPLSSPSFESEPPLESLDSVLTLSAVDQANSNSLSTTDKPDFDAHHYSNFYNKPTRKERVEGLGYYYPTAPTAPLHPDRAVLYIQEQQQLQQQLQQRERPEDLDQDPTSYSSYCQDLSKFDPSSPHNPSSTACIRISLKPKIALRFLDLGFSLKTHSNNNSNSDLPNSHSTMPRLSLIRFTFPFPPYDQPFPSSVQVTGNFEDWTRSHKAGFLHRNEQEGRFETEFEIDLDQLEAIEVCKTEEEHPFRQRKILFKYVLDGHNWVTDPGQALERDQAGNLNNVCFVEDIAPVEKSEQQQQTQDQPEQTLTESATTKTLVGSQTNASEKAGDAQPSQDGSTAASSAPALRDDEHDGDGDYGVAIVQHEAVTISRKSSIERAKGEARPTIDASVAAASTSSSSPSTPMLSSSSNSIASSSSLVPSTLHTSAAAAAPTISASSVNATGSTPISPVNKMHLQSTAPPTTAVSTSTPQFPSNISLAQSNKHKSGFWKKIKKALA